MPEQKYDPEKVRAAQAAKYAEADRQMDIADAFRTQADEYEREAWKFRSQGDAIGRLLDAPADVEIGRHGDAR